MKSLTGINKMHSISPHMLSTLSSGSRNFSPFIMKYEKNRNNEFHCITGPAIVYSDDVEEYYINGSIMTKEEWLVCVRQYKI